ncbi:MAG: HEAT repeat domain-containing protein [Geobacter sp.]|nr:HEAT repeat domain-containing protein [Geobacter sp.]
MQTLRERLRSSDEEIRRMTVTTLSGYTFAEVKEFVYEALGDESWRIRKEALNVLFSWSFTEQIIEDLVGLLRASDNAGQRNSASEALEKLGVQTLPVLCRHLSDNDPDVRKFIIDILGNIGSPDAVPLLIPALRDPDSNVATAAAENLGKIGDERAVEELVKVLDSSDIPLCYTVLEALGCIGRPVPLATITPLADEVLLKKPVIDCIGIVGDVEAIPLLMEGLREKARHVRAAAANAIIRIREDLPAGVAADRVDPYLREMGGTPFAAEFILSLSDTERFLTEPMVKILGLMGDPRAVPVLLEGCRNDHLRRSCLQAFRELGTPGVEALLASYQTANEEHRCYMAYVCGELGIRESVGTLRGAMRDPSHVLRRVAAVAAGKIFEPCLIDDLAALLNDEEIDVRHGAVDSLAALAPVDRESVAAIAGRLAAAEQPEKRRSSATVFAALQDGDRLARLIKDEDANVRKAAVFALAELKSPVSVNHLVLALVDEEPDVRMAAAGALGALGGESAEQALLVALKDQNSWVKCAALRSLGALRVAAAESAIVGLIEETDGLVLISALRTLLDINGERAHQLARNALAHPDKEVVKAAVEILSHTNDSWLDEFRDRLLFHEHWDIRSLFIKALAEHRGVQALPALQEALKCEPDDLVRRQIMDIVDGFA